ncbi:MAG: AEC family transporter [Cumulibacter sp.]
MAARIISILFPLFAIAALGYVVARRRAPDLTEANRLNMDVFTPALVFGALAGRHVEASTYGWLALAGLIVIVGSGLSGRLIALLTGHSPRTLVPPMTFNNCGNLGIPVALLTFGEDAVPAAVVLFALSNTLHFSFGAWYLDHHANLWSVLRNPSVLAAIAGLSVSLLDIPIWDPLLQTVVMVGNVAIPLMLFGLGVRMATTKISALGFALIVAISRPIIGMSIAAALIAVFDLPHIQAATLLIFGALPPAVLNFMFAERYHQEPDKVASAVLLGNLFAVLFLPIALAFVL